MSKGRIAYLPMLITYVLCKKSHEPSFLEVTGFLVLLKKASLAAQVLLAQQVTTIYLNVFNCNRTQNQLLHFLLNI